MAKKKQSEEKLPDYDQLLKENLKLKKDLENQKVYAKKLRVQIDNLKKDFPEDSDGVPAGDEVAFVRGRVRVRDLRS